MNDSDTRCSNCQDLRVGKVITLAYDGSCIECGRTFSPQDAVISADRRAHLEGLYHFRKPSQRPLWLRAWVAIGMVVAGAGFLVIVWTALDGFGKPKAAEGGLTGTPSVTGWAVSFATMSPVDFDKLLDDQGARDAQQSDVTKAWRIQ